MPRLHTMPEFLVGLVTETVYEKLLSRKAAAHVRRDRKRGRKATGSQFKEAIHGTETSNLDNDGIKPMRRLTKETDSWQNK